MTKKYRKRGFTLVELIVVLVILAILAALLVPALTGYIDKARKSQVVAETRALTQAVQTELSSLYATDTFAAQVGASTSFVCASKDGKKLQMIGDDKQLLTNLQERYNDIVNLSEVPSLEKGTGSFFAVADSACKLRWVVYYDGKGYYGIYCQVDGTITGYTKDEVKNYDSNYSHYIGRVVCDATAAKTDPTAQVPWNRALVYANLGLESMG